MTEEDATLDDFVTPASAEDGDDEADDHDSEVDDHDSEADSPSDETDDQHDEPDHQHEAEHVVTPNSETVDPATVTSRWTGAGARCGDCGSHVERLWRDGETMVCSACKDW